MIVGSGVVRHESVESDEIWEDVSSIGDSEEAVMVRGRVVFYKKKERTGQCRGTAMEGRSDGLALSQDLNISSLHSIG